ncbi:MAG: putative tRNA dimethylallyltransferase [Candidatus Saccharibacteria bacterium]|nr:putative tRNA dimethylallyltransferase [Candidatus Saccharibacteria bacterium]
MVAGPLVVIVGETASGKTALGIELARRFDGEIIAADSRTVYRGLDIGTAKPSRDEQAAARHHLIDVVGPDETFNAADFKRLALAAIEDISARGKLPIMVGGTGLYIDSVIYDYQFRPPADKAERERLDALSVEALQAEITARGLPMPANALNRRHLTRTLETDGAEHSKSELRPNTLVLGLAPEREVLDQRISDRVDVMMAAGLIEEARRLFEAYGPDVPALETPGYSALRQYLDGSLDLDQTKALFAQNDRYLAKRQRTWFKRNNSIHWLPQQGSAEKAVELTTTFLHTK